jgi:SAM-dependent methyltransferase
MHAVGRLSSEHTSCERDMTTQLLKTAFAGTANDYAAYRPPYPDAFLSHLRNAARTTGHGVLLDLACGPGRIAIPMAPHFRRVVAVDIEPEMIAVGKQRANQLGITTIDWRVTAAEQLQLAPASVELVTIGEAFHRLDQRRMLHLANEWLVQDGMLATLAGESIWSGPEPWKRIVVAVANRWTNISLPEPTTAPWGEPFEIFGIAGWQVVQHQMRVETIWTTDSIIGFMRSTSFTSANALGDKVEQFEADLRQELLAFASSDRFVADQRFGYTLATRKQSTE